MTRKIRIYRSRDYIAQQFAEDPSLLNVLERNYMGHRKLDPELKLVDVRLQEWAPWAKPRYTELGYPTRAVMERMNEGGILAKDMSPPPMPEWPVEVVLVETQVAKLPIRHCAAVMATYFHLALPKEKRAEIYAVLVKYLLRTRPQRRLMRIRSEPAAYRDNLDRARWTIKHALEL